ncbi:MAG: hypothetical protein OXH75_20895 [Acidobacteria bacterium]|nr:hypothetical protein [Acidobacteriota bacterium]
MDAQTVIAAASVLLAALGLLFVADRRGASRSKEVSDAVKAAEGQLRTDLKDTEKQLRAALRESEERLRTDLRESETRLRTDLKDSEERFRRESDGIAGKLADLSNDVSNLRVSLLQMPNLPEGIVSGPEGLRMRFERQPEGIVSDPEELRMRFERRMATGRLPVPGSGQPVSGKEDDE